MLLRLEKGSVSSVLRLRILGMASFEPAFRPLLPDVFAEPVKDKDLSCKDADPILPDSAQIVSLQAYKALRSLKQCESTDSIHHLDRLLPLINEARLRPVRFYRGLEEWLLDQNQDQG